MADTIYLDNAATSWPKPAPVAAAMMATLQEAGNPGRSGHALARNASRQVLAAREAVARLFGLPDPARIVFTRNATEALNLAVAGVLQPGDRVVTTGIEHNAVMRPLRALATTGVELVVVPCAPDGRLDPDDLRRALSEGAELVVVCHGSNVLGSLQPLTELGEIAHAAGALFAVDAAQTAGAIPLQLDGLPVDLLAFTGHKSLLGPQGTGGLYIRPRLEIAPLICGGTGSLSEHEYQPPFAPDRYESGTPNVPGLAGLAAAVNFLLERGVENVRAHEVALMEHFLDGLREIPGLTVYGPARATDRCGVVSINLAGVSPSALGQALEEGFGIMTRVGLHCAPAAHRTAGSFPQGSVRFSLSPLTPAEHVDAALAALRELALALG